VPTWMVIKESYHLIIHPSVADVARFAGIGLTILVNVEKSLPGSSLGMGTGITRPPGFRRAAIDPVQEHIGGGFIIKISRVLLKLGYVLLDPIS